MELRIMLIVMGLILTTNVWAAAGDVVIMVSDQAIPAHGVTSTSGSAQGDNSLPYTRGILALPATVGQLTKQSDLIILGSITNVAAAGGEYSWRYLLNVNIHEVLFGECPSNYVRLLCNSSGDAPSRVPTNEFVIIFGAMKEFWPPDTFPWAFDPKSAKATDLGRMEVVKGAAGIIPTSSSTSIISVVRGYVRHLRSKSGRDPVEYAKFLKSIQSQSNSRVRDDVRDDLLLLLDFGGASIRRAIVERAGLSEEMKGYADWFERRRDAIRSRVRAVDKPLDSSLKVQ